MCAQKATGTVVIQVACGFRRKPISVGDYKALSVVDEARGRAAYKIQATRQCPVWTTGMVPYDVAEPRRTLANLNAGRLRDEFGGYAALQVPGFNAFSESWNACLEARECNMTKIVVVSSDFYFAAYRRMWEAAARRNNLDIEIIEVEHGDLVSLEVWSFYKGFKAQTLSRVAASSKIGHWLAKTLADRMTASRATEGFRIDGHTVIG